MAEFKKDQPIDKDLPAPVTLQDVLKDISTCDRLQAYANKSAFSSLSDGELRKVIEACGARMLELQLPSGYSYGVDKSNNNTTSQHALSSYVDHAMHPFLDRIRFLQEISTTAKKAIAERDLGDLKSPKLGVYPPYKHLIKTNPDIDDFRAAWKDKHGYPPEMCRVINDSPEKFEFKVRLPSGRSEDLSSFIDGTFKEYTEAPVLDGKSFYYSGCGCPWATDLNRDHYHKIDPETGLPAFFPEVEREEIIRRFVVNNFETLGRFFLPKLEGE